MTALRPYFCENAKDGKFSHFLLVKQLGSTARITAFALTTTDQVDGAGRDAASRGFYPRPRYPTHLKKPANLASIHRCGRSLPPSQAFIVIRLTPSFVAEEKAVTYQDRAGESLQR
jgi:hypothetical protein